MEEEDLCWSHLLGRLQNLSPAAGSHALSSLGHSPRAGKAWGTGVLGEISDQGVELICKPGMPIISGRAMTDVWWRGQRSSTLKTREKPCRTAPSESDIEPGDSKQWDSGTKVLRFNTTPTTCWLCGMDESLVAWSPHPWDESIANVVLLLLSH